LTWGIFMKKQSFSVAIGVIAATSGAYANESDWEGFSLKLGASASRATNEGNSSFDTDYEYIGYEGNDFYSDYKDSTTDARGFVGLGYDTVLANGLVFGVFGEYNFGDQKTSNYQSGDGIAYDDGYYVKDTTTLKNSLNLGVRLGKLLTEDNDLVYVSGGVASGEFDQKTLGWDEYNGVGLTASDNSREVGGFIGIGYERNLMSGFRLSAEYRHTNYSDFNKSRATDDYDPYHNINFAGNEKNDFKTDEFRLAIIKSF